MVHQLGCVPSLMHSPEGKMICQREWVHVYIYMFINGVCQEWRHKPSGRAAWDRHIDGADVLSVCSAIIIIDDIIMQKVRSNAISEYHFGRA